MLPVRWVLLRPRNAENLGAVARGMKNFGLDDWTLVDPNPELLPPREASLRMAVGATELLAAVKVAARLEEAVADCSWVVGTSMRRLPGKRSLSPREVAADAAQRAPQGRVAVVFGDERSGLTNDELQRCHDLSAIPSDDGQPSLNLAQAALLYGYELKLAFQDAARTTETSGALAPRAATDAEFTEVAAALTAALLTGGFLVSPERHAVRDLVAPLQRSRLTRAEARLWTAAMRTITVRR